ncbi:CUE domain protein [Aspergillus sp. HF37]|nr:CUE domain protein [Aspergillus sp. HF37]
MRSQVESDELYARQLAEHYNRRRAPRSDLDEQYEDSRRGSANSEEKDYNDLPVIRDNIRKGFFETQSKVNSWVQNLKKRMDGEETEGEQSGEGYNEAQQGYSRPRHSGDMGRRSGDREHYDADPQVLSDDLTALELKDTEAPPPRPPRPNANPASQKTSSPDKRKVSFQEGPPTQIDDIWDAPPAVKRYPSAGSKPSKWQPLSTVEPSPVAENDPFSLGDSDDDKDGKAKDQKTAAEGDRIKEETAEAMTGEMGHGSKDDSKADGSGK